MNLARVEGTVILKGIGRSTAIDPLPVVRKGLSVRGQAGATPSHYETALAWCAEFPISPGRVVTNWLPLNDAEEGFAIMNSRAGIVGFVH
jgi:threonine dehydrogenase-like Zn-dependent dehydrogenase